MIIKKKTKPIVTIKSPLVTEAPFDPATFFDCEYGFTTMTGSSLFKGIMGIEKCKTWCYIREDTVSQSE